MNETTTSSPSRTRIQFDLRDELSPDEMEKFEAAAKEAGAESITEHFFNLTIRLPHNTTNFFQGLRHLERLSIVARNTTNGVLFTDNERRIIWSNEGFTQITGYAAHEVLGRRPSFLQGEGTDRSILKKIQARLERGEGFHEVLLNYTKTGQPYWNEVEVKPYYDTDGNRLGFFAIQSDITAKKQAEERLQQSAKRDAIERLAGGIAHDFNNFLANMTLSAEILRQEAQLSAAGRRHTETLLEEIGAATTVARQLLAFSKAQPTQFEELDLRGFLTASAEFAVRGSSTTYSVEGVAPTDRLHTSRDLLQQILFNLIINARQAMREHGHVTLRLHRSEDPDWLLLAVEDCGPGISPALQSHIFEVYYTTRKEGSGLGLYVVRTLTERLGGRVEVSSIPGKGTTFTLSLPRRLPRPEEAVAPAPAVESSEPMSAKVSAAPERTREVWLLEDDKRQSSLVMALLSNENLRARAFFSGEDLLVALEELNPDDLGAGRVFILDITIRGGLGGLDVCQALRERLPVARISLVSGYSDEWERRRGELEDLRIGFLAKPYRLSDLRKKVLFAETLADPAVGGLCAG